MKKNLKILAVYFAPIVAMMSHLHAVAAFTECPQLEGKSYSCKVTQDNNIQDNYIQGMEHKPT